MTITKRTFPTRRGPAARTGLAALTVVGVVALAACSIGTKEVAQSDVENQIATQLANQLKQPKPTVTCPGNLPAKVGATMDCQLTPQGETTKLAVHVSVDTVANGVAHFSINVGDTSGSTTTTAGGSTETSQPPTATVTAPAGDTTTTASP